MTRPKGLKNLDWETRAKIARDARKMCEQQEKRAALLQEFWEAREHYFLLSMDAPPNTVARTRVNPARHKLRAQAALLAAQIDEIDQSMDTTPAIAARHGASRGYIPNALLKCKDWLDY